MFKDIKELPKGTRDLIGNECRKIEYVTNSINKYFDDIGYEEVITPSFEFYNTFNDVYKSIDQEKMYKFYDNEGKILALKSDSTLPIARLVSSKLKDKKFPLRIRYSSKIFKVNKNLSGKKNEMFDAGIELIGENNLNSDLEVLILAIDSILNLGFDDFKIEVGHIGIIQKIISKLEINKIEKRELVRFIDDKKLVDLDEFLEKSDIKKAIKDVLRKLPWMFGDISDLKSEKTMIYDEEILSYMNSLEYIYESLKKLNFDKYISFDLGASSKIDYYSGIVFKGYLKGASSHILKGGRYDNLMNSYGEKVSAIGFSLKIDDIAKLLDEKLLERKDVTVLNYDDKTHLQILTNALELRRNGRKVVLSKEEGKL